MIPFSFDISATAVCDQNIHTLFSKNISIKRCIWVKCNKMKPYSPSKTFLKDKHSQVTINHSIPCHTNNFAKIYFLKSKKIRYRIRLKYLRFEK